jgi:hypothetical protein
MESSTVFQEDLSGWQHRQGLVLVAKLPVELLVIEPAPIVATCVSVASDGRTKPSVLLGDPVVVKGSKEEKDRNHRLNDVQHVFPSAAEHLVGASGRALNALWTLGAWRTGRSRVDGVQLLTGHAGIDLVSEYEREVALDEFRLPFIERLGVR